MWPVSSAFLAALRSPAMTVRTLVKTSTGVTLRVDGGQVEIDSGRDITRSAKLSILPTDALSLGGVYDLLMTPTVEVTIWRGLALPGGTDELVPLGVFSTSEMPMPRRLNTALDWSGLDRAKKVSRARLVDVWPVASGTTLAAMVTALVQDRAPGVPIDMTGVVGALGAAITLDAGASSDPWKLLRQTLADHGWDLAFSGDGVLRGRAVQDPTSSPAVFDFGSGAGQLIIDGQTTGSFESSYSGVVATGEGSGITTPTRGEAWDDDPASPTYWEAYGRVPYFMSSPLLTTNAAAAQAAAGMLPKVKGRRETLSWSSIVAPMLEPLDVVAMGGGSRFMLDSLTIPMRASEPMSAKARATKVA